MFLPEFNALITRDDPTCNSDQQDCGDLDVGIVFWCVFGGVLLFCMLGALLATLVERRRRPSLEAGLNATAEPNATTQGDGPVGDTETGSCITSVDPYHEMSKSFDDSIIHKDNTFEGPALPEQTHANPPPSYSILSTCQDAEVKVPSYHELGIELSPISPPPSAAHCD